MSVCDNNEIVKEKFKNDNFAKMMGIELEDLTETSIRMKMKLTEKMENLYGYPHGAAIYGLADAAFSIIANNQNNISVALDCTITYHKAPKTGQVLYVHGSTIATSKRIGTYLFDVYTLENDEKIRIATMKGTAYRTGKKIKE
ncbi:MAG: PaaI family thioesterase [Promethearchaeota archaeon]